MYKYLLIFLCLFNFSIAKDAKDIVIATGSKSGNYYQVGKELNKTWYKGQAKVINTQGSVENLLLLAEKKVDVAITQADALDFLDIFYESRGKTSEDFVKIVSELYTETLHIVVAKNSKIKTMNDLNGKIMVSGGKRSGSSVTAGFIEKEFDLEFKSVLDVSIKKGLELLKKGKVDVVFYVSRAPSNLLNKYKKHIRLLSVDRKVDNKHIQVVKLPKLIYDFVKKDTNTYGVSSYIVTQKNSKSSDKTVTYTEEEKLLTIPPAVLKKYNTRYGNRALHKLVYYNDKLADLQNETTLVKLIKVNDIVNKNRYIKDKRHWKKNDYWSKPLQFLGTALGDSEEFALTKFMFLVKLGLDPNKFKFLDLEKPVKLKYDKPDKQNIVLAYYHNDSSPAIILENRLNTEKIYLLKDDMKYKELTGAKNKIYRKVFREDFTEKDIDFIVSQF